jgi:SAM-dependent methyltransferase
LRHRIDQARLHDLQKRHGSPQANAPDTWHHYAKYLDIDKFLRINVRRVQYLQLHRSAPKEILDVGCGAGFFLFIAKTCGHQGLGLDTGGIPLFDDLIDLLGVERIIGRIKLLKPLPDLGRKFDLITAFSPAFHGGGGTSWHWGAKEWDYLVSDLEGHLKPGGRIFFGLNPAYNGKFYTNEIRDMFLHRGAAIERENVLFPAKEADPVPANAVSLG